MKHARKKVKKGSKVLTVILSVLVVILAAAAIFSWLILNDSADGWKKETAAPSAALGDSVIKSALTGKEYSFSANEAGGYLNYLLREHRTGVFSKIDYVVLRLSGDGTADIYFPVQDKGKSLGVTMNFTPSCDINENRLVFQINSFHLGRLPIKPSWVLKMIKNKMPSGFTADNNVIYYRMPRIEAKLGAVSAKTQLTELKANKEHFKVRANTSLGLTVSNG